MKYAVNSIIKWKNSENEVKERMLWIGEEILYVIDINKNNCPYVRTIDDVDRALKGEKAIIEKDGAFASILKEEDIPEKHKRMRDKHWDMIAAMVDQEPDIFQSYFRRKAICDVAKKNKVSELSILGYLKRYWKRGKTPNALLPDYLNCGGRGKEKKAGSVKRGRPTKYKDVIGEGINITEDIKRIFRIAINRFYYTIAKNSLVLTYELMRKEYFNSGYKMENGVQVPIIKPQSEIPTFGQFRYWFEKERDIKREITSRYSNKKYQKQYRAITGNANDGILQPGTFEIDCQVGDVYLVSRFNRNWVIGRPAIYAVIDKFSRMICGFYVGLESGSYAGAMMALLNATTDKVAFCKQFGIDIKKEEWPICHLPETIIADRGELEGGSIDNLINTLNVKVQNTPPYQAELKSAVERFFGLNNDRVKPFMPGVVNLDGRERGDKDYRLNAKLDLYQFTQIMIKAILYHNNYYHLNYYKREEMMIEDDVPCIPVHLFNWGVSNRGGTLRSVSEDIVKLALMPCDTAAVTAKGVKYKDMYYASKSMLKEQVFVRARSNGTWKVKITYDPRNMDYIYVHGDASNKYEKCCLIDDNSRYRNKVMEEIDYLLVVEKLNKIRMKDSEAQAKTQLITEIENIINKAEDDFNKEIDTGESDRQRVKNIRENRKIEKRANRVKESFELDEQEQDKSTSNVLAEELFDEAKLNSMALLMKKQREGLQ